MTRREFLDTLGRALRRELSEQEVLDNLRYYEDYIDREVRSGRSEAQVLAELGDPRLIARTILQVDEQREEAGSYRRTVYTEDGGRQTVFTEDGDGFSEETVYTDGQEYGRRRHSPFDMHVHVFGWKSWLILLLVIFLIFLVLGTMFAVLWKLLPFILIVAGASWIYRRFFGGRR